MAEYRLGLDYAWTTDDEEWLYSLVDVDLKFVNDESEIVGVLDKDLWL